MATTYFGQVTGSQKTSLGREPYYSRFTDFEKLDKNYILIGFTPGMAVQAAELNEIQDNFQKNLTLSNYMFSFWTPVLASYLQANSDETVESILWNGAVPLNPAQVQVISSGIRFLVGWYYYTHPSGLCYWVHNNTQFDLPIQINSSTIGTFIGLTIDSSDISAFEDELLFDNSGGFINTSSPGAYRIKNSIVGFTNTGNLTTIKPILAVTSNGYEWMNGIPLSGA